MFAQNYLNEEVLSFLKGARWKIVKSDCGLPIVDKSMLLNYNVFNGLNFKSYSHKGVLISNENISIQNVKRLSNGYFTFEIKIPLTKKEQQIFGRVADIHKYNVIDNNTIKIEYYGCKQVLERFND
jgi:hypothetical protein